MVETGDNITKTYAIHETLQLQWQKQAKSSKMEKMQAVSLAQI